MKAVPCKSCRDCPHFVETPYYTSDSWERASYWWCSNPDVEEVEYSDEEIELTKNKLKEDSDFKKLRKIRGYVEWHEERKIPIPHWCPLPNIY